MWDATCPNALILSHLLMVMRKAGAIAKDDEYQKCFDLVATPCFTAATVGTLGILRNIHIYFSERGSKHLIVVFYLVISGIILYLYYCYVFYYKFSK